MKHRSLVKQCLQDCFQADEKVPIIVDVFRIRVRKNCKEIRELNHRNLRLGAGLNANVTGAVTSEY